jgi:hypothetical protein
MTELFIDNQAVVLGNASSFEMIRQNPFFSKSGTITLEITLSLLHPTNAKIYRHYNRINSENETLSKRPARLVVDGSVWMNGTEIMLEITQKEVKIQLASGESELNYFIGGDKKLHDLDLGIINVSEEPVDYFYAPIWSSNENKVMNVYSKTSVGNWAYSRDIPQPYLSRTIDRIIHALGYKKKTSIFDSVYGALYIVNGISSFNFSTRKMNFNRTLPNWTVNDFFTEIEKLFAVVFLINENTKEVDVVFQKDFYANKAKHYIEKTLDEYSQVIDLENKTNYAIGNTGYALPDDSYFDFQNIDPEILETITGNEIIELENFDAILDAIKNSQHKYKVYYSKESDTQYICYEEEDENGTKTYYPKKVNAFAPIRNNPASEDIDIELKITPAPIKTVDVDGTSNPLNPITLRTQMPVTETGIYNETFYDIQKAVEEGMENPVNTRLMLAIVNDLRAYQPGVETDNGVYRDMRAGRVDCFEADFYQTKEGHNYKNSLRLNGKYGLQALYENTNSIDTTRQYTFRFIYPGTLDCKAIFVINNREFACAELKYTVNEREINPVIEGKFYPMK